MAPIVKRGTRLLIILIHDQKQFEPDGSPSPLYKTRLEALHQLMIDHGDGSKPIWVTEIGWEYTPQVQAAYLKSAFEWLDQRPYVTVVAVHLLNDWNEETYGLMTTVPNLYHTTLNFTATTTLVPKQPFYDAYKYYPKRKLPTLADAAANTKIFPDTLHSVQQPFLAAWQSGRSGFVRFAQNKPILRKKSSRWTIIIWCNILNGYGWSTIPKAEMCSSACWAANY